MDDGNCLPSALDNAKQRDDYIKHVERIMVNNIPCLGFLANLCTNHIPHQHSSEMKKKSDTVSIDNNV